MKRVVVSDSESDSEAPHHEESPAKRQRLQRSSNLNGENRVEELLEERLQRFETLTDQGESQSTNDTYDDEHSDNDSLLDNDEDGSSDDAHGEFAGLRATTRINRKRHSERQISFIEQLRQAERAQKQARRDRLREASRAEKIRTRQVAQDLKKRELILSLTIEWNGRDLPREFIETFRRWLDKDAAWWSFSYERGSTCGYAHLQGVGVFFDVSKNAVKKSWYVFSGWDVNSPPVRVSVMFRETSGKGLSTQLGLLGYVRKDIGKYEDHFHLCSANVSDAERAEGDQLYCAMGKADKTTECLLSESNFIDRAAVFYERKIRNPALSHLDHVLKEMLNTGRYAIHGKFFAGGGLVFRRAQAAFHAKIFPTSTTEEDVHGIFFNKKLWAAVNYRDSLHERLDSARSALVTRDGPDAPDPFEANDEHVLLDRCIAEGGRDGLVDPDPNSHQWSDGVVTLVSPVQSTESATQEAAEQSRSLYDVCQDFVAKYGDGPWHQAGDLEQRMPTRQQLQDPRFPPFFVQRDPGLNQRFSRPDGERTSSTSGRRPDETRAANTEVATQQQEGADQLEQPQSPASAH